MRNRILAIVFSVLLMLACTDKEIPDFNYQPPQGTDDGFVVGSLSDVNINSQHISNMLNDISSGFYSGVHSVLIYKDDRLVLEEYFSGHRFDYMKPEHRGEIVNWGADSLHRVMSVTKSITSICVGIAVQNGFIKSVNQSIFEYLPEYKHLAKDGRESISIEHLLTMTSGLDGNEWLMPYANPENAILKVYLNEDPINHILGLEHKYDSGSVFQYYGGSNILLGEIIRNASGMNMHELAEMYLFGPLGIKQYNWIQINKGIIDGAGGISLTPRDMLKIGVLFLNNGKWKDTQIVSDEWVQNSASPYSDNSWMNNWDDHWGMRGYAYSWWTHSFVKSNKKVDMFYAAGWGGQYIMVIPDLNMVVAFTGENYTSYRPSFDLLKKYILNAVN